MACNTEITASAPTTRRGLKNTLRMDDAKHDRLWWLPAGKAIRRTESQHAYCNIGVFTWERAVGLQEEKREGCSGIPTQVQSLDASRYVTLEYLQLKIQYFQCREAFPGVFQVKTKSSIPQVSASSSKSVSNSLHQHALSMFLHMNTDTTHKVSQLEKDSWVLFRQRSALCLS